MWRFPLSGFITMHPLRSNGMSVDTQLKNRLDKAGHFFGWYVKYYLGHKCMTNAPLICSKKLNFPIKIVKQLFFNLLV